jgi:hypothetical protein
VLKAHNIFAPCGEAVQYRNVSDLWAGILPPHHSDPLAGILTLFHVCAEAFLPWCANKPFNLHLVNHIAIYLSRKIFYFVHIFMEINEHFNIIVR